MSAAVDVAAPSNRDCSGCSSVSDNGFGESLMRSRTTSTEKCADALTMTDWSCVVGHAAPRRSWEGAIGHSTYDARTSGKVIGPAGRFPGLARCGVSGRLDHPTAMM